MVKCEVCGIVVASGGSGSRTVSWPCWAALPARTSVSRRLGVPFNPATVRPSVWNKAMSSQLRPIVFCKLSLSVLGGSVSQVNTRSPSVCALEGKASPKCSSHAVRFSGFIKARIVSAFLKNVSTTFQKPVSLDGFRVTGMCVSHASHRNGCWVDGLLQHCCCSLTWSKAWESLCV